MFYVSPRPRLNFLDLNESLSSCLSSEVLSMSVWHHDATTRFAAIQGDSAPGPYLRRQSKLSCRYLLILEACVNASLLDLRVEGWNTPAPPQPCWQGQQEMSRDRRAAQHPKEQPQLRAPKTWSRSRAGSAATAAGAALRSVAAPGWAAPPVPRFPSLAGGRGPSDPARLLRPSVRHERSA